MSIYTHHYLLEVSTTLWKLLHIYLNIAHHHMAISHNQRNASPQNDLHNVQDDRSRRLRLGKPVSLLVEPVLGCWASCLLSIIVSLIRLGRTNRFCNSFTYSALIVSFLPLSSLQVKNPMIFAFQVEKET